MINFLVVGTQRTGSSALAELIGIHPDISCGWESTNLEWPSKKISAAQRFLTGDFSRLDPEEQSFLSEAQNQNYKALGFRRLFRSSNKWLVHPKYSPAIYFDRLEAHIDWLRYSRPDIFIIHIVRVDNLAWLKSMGLAKATGAFFGHPYPPNTNIHWNLAVAEKRVRAKIWAGKRLASLANSNPYLRVEYEEFRSDNAACTKLTTSFLGLPQNPIKLHSAKAKIQSSVSVEDGFTNYHELRDHLDRCNLLKDTDYVI